MLSRLWGGRRAEAFEDAVNGHVELADNELSKFVHLAHTVREMPGPRLSNESRIAMRARLVAEAESVLATSPATPVRYVRKRKHRAVRAAVGATVVMGAMSGGVVSVSANALPGDMLYPVKLGVERVETSLNGEPAEAGRTRFEHAATRLEEAEQLARAGETDSISGALGGFSEEADAGADQLLRAFASNADANSITAIRSFTHSAAGQLTAVAELIDETSIPAYSQAVSTITAIDKRAVAACPECSVEPPLEVPYNVEPESGDQSYTLPPIMLPDLDDRFLDDHKDELPDGVLTDPQLVPPDQDLPDHDETVPPDNSDNKGDDGRNEPIRPHGGKDHGSDPQGDSRPKDGGTDLLPDLQTDDGSTDVIPTPRLDDVPKALDDLVGKLGPLSPLDDVLGPLLGDNGTKGQKNDRGPLGDLLGPLLGDNKSGDGKNKSENDDDSDGPLGDLLGPDDEGEQPEPEQTDPGLLDPTEDDTEEQSELPDLVEPEEDRTEQDSDTYEELDPLDGTNGDTSDVEEGELDGTTR